MQVGSDVIGGQRGAGSAGPGGDGTNGLDDEVWVEVEFVEEEVVERLRVRGAGSDRVGRG